MESRHYTEEEKQFFREYVYGHSHVEIRNEFIRRFGREITTTQVSASIKRYGLKTGRTGRFEKGQKAWNKDKKMSPELYAKCAPTMFKKGQTTHNHRPVGSERVDTDGYRLIKVEEPGKWDFVHKVVWREHNGEIPKDSVIIFLDKNKLNCDISNLKLIKRSELLMMNKKDLYSEDPALTELGTNLAKLLVERGHAKQRRKKNATV